MQPIPSSSADHETRRSPHAAQLERGFARLVFEPALEADFREAFNERMRPRLAYTMLAGALFFAAFGIKDLLTMPKSVWVWTVSIRLGLIVPSILLIYLFTRHRSAAGKQGWMALGAAIALYGLMAAIGISTWMQHPLPYEGLLLVTFFLFFMVGLRLRMALLVSLPAVPLFVLTSVAIEQDHSLTIVRGFYLLAGNAIGAIGLYLIEHLAREVWLTEQLARFRAERDPLTLSFNRRALMAHLRLLWAQARRQRETMTAVMIDVDHFKQYNDRYGHLAGDECLRQISTVLAGQLRRPLDMLGRYGGEEFLALLLAVQPESVASMAEKLRAAVEAMQLPHSGSVLGVVTVSIGVASRVPGSSDGESALLEQADRALYEAKGRGRNQVQIHAG